MGGNCPNQKEMQQQGFMLGDNTTYNAFLPGARELVLESSKQRSFRSWR